MNEQFQVGGFAGTGINVQTEARARLFANLTPEFLICMGFDAMRVAMGKSPRNYSVHGGGNLSEVHGKRTAKGG